MGLLVVVFSVSSVYEMYRKTCRRDAFFVTLQLEIKPLTKKTITLVATANLMEFFFILNEFCNYFEPERKNQVGHGQGHHVGENASFEIGVMTFLPTQE